MSRRSAGVRRALQGVLLAGLVALAAGASASGQEPTTRPALNKYCPVMTDEEANPRITTVYKGRTIAFCCDTCRAKFNANPERYFARLTSAESNPEAEETAKAGETGPGGNHDHESAEEAARPGDADHSATADRPPLLARVHPVLVHFPVAGIPLALLGLLTSLVSRKQIFAAADVPPLLLATLVAVAAVITGNIAHDTMRFAPSLHEYIHWHQYAGTSVMILALGLSALRVWRWRRLTGAWLWLYGAGLVLASLLVGVTGYLGGSIVFGPDHLAW